MFNGSEQELCLLDLGVLCSCGLEPRVLRLARKWFWKGGVVTSAREGKGRADELGLCPEVPSVMRGGGPSAAEDRSGLGHPNQTEAWTVRITGGSSERAGPGLLGTEYQAWAQGLARSVVAQELFSQSRTSHSLSAAPQTPRPLGLGLLREAFLAALPCCSFH